MQELEKILKDIEQAKGESWYRMNDHVTKSRIDGAIERITDIIRKHMNAGWIPLEERLPEAGKSVLCCSDDERMIIGVLHKEYYIDFGIAVAENYNQIMHDVIAWRPLPEPYRPERSMK